MCCSTMGRGESYASRRQQAGSIVYYGNRAEVVHDFGRRTDEFQEAGGFLEHSVIPRQGRISEVDAR